MQYAHNSPPPTNVSTRTHHMHTHMCIPHTHYCTHTHTHTHTHTPHARSMMAVRSGAKMVSACDFNETLFSLSRDIVAANGLEGQVNIIHALSTSLTIPRDIPNRFVWLHT